MINDLTTSCQTVKYVDDTTIYHVTNDINDSTLQEAVDCALQWSKDNSMKINASKTKEILVSFKKVMPPVPHITVNGEEIERVSHCKLLGVYLNDQLNWNTHVDQIFKRASQRLHFLSCLKRSKLSCTDLVKVYTSLVRPVTEYACQVWHPGLTIHQTQLIESLQERALKIIHPGTPYDNALTLANLDTLDERRKKLCEKLFVSAQDPQHRLFPLLPPLRDTTTSRRDTYMYQIPFVHTGRFKDTFINYCLSNKW